MYQKQIVEYAKNNTVFFISEIQEYLKISMAQRAVFNTELCRIEKKGQLKRLAHGLYAVPKQSLFGVVLPNEHVIAKHVYIDNGNGYITGPSFLNQIGLSTWIPQKTYLKSNNAKRNIGLKTFSVSNPCTHISEDNKQYLQLLDGLADLQKYATDNPRINEIVCEYIEKSDLDTTKLLLMAHKFFNCTVQNRLYEIMEECYKTTC